MSSFKLQNIERVNFVSSGGGEGVSMVYTSGGVSVDGFIAATTGVSAGNLRLKDSSITVAGGGTQIDFGIVNLITTGGMSANSGMSAGSLVLSSGSITDTSNAITFNNNSLTGTGPVDFSGGVSLSGGVSVNGYHYPTSLGTSQFLYYKNATTGVSGYGLSGGTDISLSYGENVVTINNTGGGGGGNVFASAPFSTENSIIVATSSGSRNVLNRGVTIDNSNNITTTGGVSANSGMSAGSLVLSSGSITDTSNAITFNNNSLTGTGPVDFSGGVSLSGGVSVNGYHYPTSLGTSQFLYYKNATTGVSGYGLSGGTDISLSYGENVVTINNTGGGGGGATNIDSLTDAFADATNVVLGVSPPSISGNDNVGVGVSALNAITTGSRNIAIGSDALFKATTTEDNIGIGYSALNNISVLTGGGPPTMIKRNIALGTSALTTGSISFGDLYDNVAIGYLAGQNIVASFQNTIVGASAGITLTGGLGNNTIIGFGANSSTATISNEVTLGNGSVTALRCADTTIASLSDARDKNDIRDLPYGLNFLENVRPVEFTWDKRLLTPDDENDPKQGKRRAGFIAQELQEAMPSGENDILDLVYESNPQRLEAKYGNLIPVMVKAIQDLKEEVDTLKNHLNLE